MSDLLYISEVGNYQSLNASFRIEWPAPDQGSVLFLSDFSSRAPIIFRIS